MLPFLLRGSCILAVTVLVGCGETPQPPSDPSPQGPVLLVDDEGFFSAKTTGAWGGEELYPARNVRFAWPPPGGLDGRLWDPTAHTTFYRRTPAGRLVEYEMPIERLVGTHEPILHRLIALQAPTLGERSEHASLASAVGRLAWGGQDRVRVAAPVVPADLPVVAAAGPPPAGADLAAWAPSNLLFVRFRSVASMYRMTAELGRLAGALLAARGDGRDFGTRRLTLHDLLLPTIWHTNPGAATGVGEVGMVVAAPRVRGRLRGALLFRIVDPELHRMQTAAGISQESVEDHLWKPEHDPFPGLRERRNFRRVVGDVEIVATDRDLLEVLAGGVAHPLSGDDGYIAARGPAGEPDRREAFFVYASAVARRDLFGAAARAVALRRLVDRVSSGTDFLVEAWTGLTVSPAAPDQAARDGSSAGSSAAGSEWPLRDFEFARGVTRADGLVVNVRFVTKVAAEAATALGALPGEISATDGACRSNLAGVSPVALVEREFGDLAERAFVVLGFRPVCPLAGKYTVDPITRRVRCSVHGRLDSFESVPPRASWVGSVTAEDRGLLFQLKIDWSRRR